MTQKQKRIIAANHDMGSAQAMVPALQRLKNEGWVIQTFAAPDAPARGVFQAAGFWPQAPDSDWGSVLIQGMPSLVLVGVSVKDDGYEKQVLEAATRHGHRTAIIVESWPQRWLQVYGERDKPLYRRADRIFLVDRFSCDFMAAQGFDPAKLVATGNPAQDVYGKLRAEREMHRLAYRERFGIPQDYVLFQWSMSADLDDPAQDRPGHSEWNGFYELDSLVEFLGALAAWKEYNWEGLNVSGVVRQKPTHGSMRVQRLIDAIAPECVTFDNGRETGNASILASDAVFGAVTMMVQNAAMLGTPGIYYLPDTDKPSGMVATELGFTRTFSERWQMRDAVDDIASKDDTLDSLKAPRSIELPADATGNVVKAIKALVHSD